MAVIKKIDKQPEPTAATAAPAADETSAQTTPATSSVKPVDKAAKSTEYLKARSRVKTGIKVGAGIAIFLVVALIVSIAGCSISGVSKEVADSNNPAKVKVSKSASSLEGEYYGDVVTLLEKDGFTNIELRPEGDLYTGFLHKDGEVDTVSIDGQTSFYYGTYFSKDAKVVVAFHSFPEKTGNTSDTPAANTNTNSDDAPTADAGAAANTSNTNTKATS